MVAGALTMVLARMLPRPSRDIGPARAAQSGAAAEAIPAAKLLPAAEPSPVPRAVPMAATGPVPRPVPAAMPARSASLRIGVLGSLTINGQAGALVPAQSQLIVALALHADARVDWREFDALAATGMRHGLPAPLTEALSMIRGQPFTGCYYWWLETSVVESVTARTVAAAEKLAELSLTSGDPAAAVRAARTGLAADCAAEQLWRIMMRAEHAAGNLAGVREAWGRCLDMVSEVAADGQPDSATSAVYDELLAR
jgi:hypothetical protein